MTSYAPELWEFYGLTPITIWDLDANHFFALTVQIDRERKRRDKEEREAKRDSR